MINMARKTKCWKKLVNKKNRTYYLSRDGKITNVEKVLGRWYVTTGDLIGQQHTSLPRAKSNATSKAKTFMRRNSC